MIDSIETLGADIPHTSKLVGWILPSAPAFDDYHFFAYKGRSVLVTGPNGVGKSQLLRLITSKSAPRVYSGIPPLLMPYVSMSVQAPSKSLAATQAEPDDTDLWMMASELHLEGTEVGDFADRFGVEPERAHTVLRVTDQGSWWIDILISGEIGGADPRTSSVLSTRVSARHAKQLLEVWSYLGEDRDHGPEDLTAASFRRWARALALEQSVEISRDGLSARIGSHRPVSLLNRAQEWADCLANRTSLRLQVLTNFDLPLRCEPADGFAWRVRHPGAEYDVSQLSDAMHRWVRLAIQETVHEMLLVVGSRVPGLQASSETPLLQADIEQVVPRGKPGPFATRDSWIAVDEPELHLFGSEVTHLANVLSSHARNGRTVAASHSMQLSAAFVGRADLIVFDSPGSYTTLPPEMSPLSVFDHLASASPAILSRTRVLYVEGTRDMQILNALFGDDLRSAGVVLSPCHGVGKMDVVAASVWQRLIGTDFAVMFDALDQADVSKAWSETLSRIAITDDPGARNRIARELRLRRSVEPNRAEVAGMWRLFAALIEGRLENRVTFVMHGLSDILLVVSPRAFGLDGDGWSNLGYEAGQPFKPWMMNRWGIQLGGRTVDDALAPYMDGGLPTDPDGFKSLQQAIGPFLGIPSQV